MTCGTCGGELRILGQLGNMTHYRCRNCGLDCSHEHQPECEFCNETDDLVELEWGCTVCRTCGPEHYPHDFETNSQDDDLSGLLA